MSVKIYPSKELQTKLGKFLKTKREEHSLSQKEVSSILGYSSPQFISNIERGLCLPPLKKLNQMVSLYKLDEYELTSMIIEFQKKIILKNLKMRA